MEKRKTSCIVGGKVNHCIQYQKYWIGQKVHSGFSIWCYEKAGTNFLINLCCQYTSLFWLSDLYFKLLIWYFSMSVPKSYFFKSQTHLIIICRLHSHHPVTVILVSHGETVETVLDFIFLGSKITADGDCSHEIKRRLLLGRKVMTNLDSYLKAETLLCQQRFI